MDSLESSQLVERDFAFCLQRTRPQLFADKNSIHFPLPDGDYLNEQVIFIYFFSFFLFLVWSMLTLTTPQHTPALFCVPSSANLAFYLNHKNVHATRKTS